MQKTGFIVALAAVAAFAGPAVAQDFTPERLERACERALVLQSYSYRVVRTLIETPATPAPAPALDLAHDNVRGPEYFQ